MTALLAAFVVVGMLVVAPTSGNIGTLVRQRDLVVPAVVWLAGAALYPIARVWS
ncbi:MAG: hypothetical protein HY047_09220 [Acidobacteria bacterium]|nr:hypothetical protein [Acidobacteriota bacterium]